MPKAPILQRCAYPSLFVSLLLAYSAQTVALGLGDLHSRSYIGERFYAQVELLAPPERGTPLAIRLASTDDYQKSGLIYPTGLSFKFALQNEVGQAATIRVNSSQAITEPFMQLLLDVSYPGARVVKAFTVLLDPAPAINDSNVPPPIELVSSKPSLAFEVAQQQTVRDEPAITVPRVREAQTPSKHEPISKRVKTNSSKAKPRSTVSHHPRAKAAVTQPYRSLLERDAEPVNSTGLKLAISTELTTSLRISKLEPHGLTSSAANEDALQEELIAKNKTLQEMTLQISEMQILINRLTAGSSAASAPPAASAVLPSFAVIDVTNTLVAPMSSVIAPISAPVQVKINRVTEASPAWWQTWQMQLLLAGVLALLGLFYAWWQRRVGQNGFQHSIFDDLHAAQQESLHHGSLNPVALNPVIVERRVTDTVQIGDVSMKVPAYKAPVPTSNPEYDLLEQADIYLQFGHDKLAEEVLQEALIINPKNVQIYLTLLDIYDTRNDAVKFAEFASELEAHADKKIWDRVCKMGKRIDPDNDLYGLHLAKVEPGQHNLHGGHVDNEFSELHVRHSSKLPPH